MSSDQGTAEISDSHKVTHPPSPHNFLSAQFPPQNQIISAIYPGVQHPWFPGVSASPLPWSSPWIPPPQSPVPTQPWPPINPSVTSAVVPIPPPRNADYMVNTLRKIYKNNDASIEIERVKVQRRSGDTYETSISYSPSTSNSFQPSNSFPLNEKRPPPRKNKIKRKMQEMAAAQTQQSSQTQQPIAQPWYPYMAYMQQYPYPYPYCVAYPAWGSGSPHNAPGVWPPAIVSEQDSGRSSSRQESLPVTIDSQCLDSQTSQPFRCSKSPDSLTSESLPVGSHISEIHEAEIAPSDSISLREYKRGLSLDRDLESPGLSQSGQSQESEKFTSNDVCKTQDWMIEMQKLLHSTQEGPTKNIAKTSTSFISDIPKAPARKKKKKIKNRQMELVDGDSKGISCYSASFDDTMLTSSATDLSTAFKDLQESVSEFQSQVSVELKVEHVPILAKSEKNQDNLNKQKLNEAFDNKNSDHIVKLPVIEPNYDIVAVNTETDLTISTNIEDTKENGQTKESATSVTSNEVKIVVNNEVIQQQNLSLDQEGKIDENDREEEISTLNSCKKTIEYDGRLSRTSTCSYHSTRPSTDDQLILLDTDSTDIVMATADEGGDHTDCTTLNGGWLDDRDPEDQSEDYSWILQHPGDAPDLVTSSHNHITREEERRNAWRAEVSLWRAKLVVSLCRGCGLDQQDWSTFQLLVMHPLSLDLKLSLLHAPRLCSSNSSVGAGLVRSALLHLTSYGEILLQPDHSRPHGWRSIKVHAGQPWAPVKGCVEILRTLGYTPREDGVLRYPRRSTTETSVLARLTLDMLVLAEELRLYITGSHQYASNVSQLFFPSTISMTVTPEPHQRYYQSSSSMADSHDSPLSFQCPGRPTSSGSYGFVSAHSTTSLEQRPTSQASSVTDDETTLQQSVTAKGRILSEEDTSLCEEVSEKFFRKNKRRLAPEPPKPKSHHSVLPTKGIILSNKRSQLSTDKFSSASLSTFSTSTDSSLPDLSLLQSRSDSRQSDLPLSVASNSSESVTPIASPVPASDYINEEDKANVAINSVSDTKKDNPEDHIYEEIGEIRAQVAALRAAEAKANSAMQPPPLPPKTRINSTGDDDSGLSLTYPNVEWSHISQNESLKGGSTGARRKKRRAPMPPDFMPQGWKIHEKSCSDSNINILSTRTSSQNDLSIRKYYDYIVKNNSQKDEIATVKNKSNSDRSLNPFYEDIDDVVNAVHVNEEKSESKVEEEAYNPFDEGSIAPIGFIGKNPFYEDVKILKKNYEHKLQMEPEEASYENISTNNTEKTCHETEIVETNISVALKPKRKAPKFPENVTTEDNLFVEHTTNSDAINTNTQDKPKKDMATLQIKITNEHQSKNVVEEQQQDSRVVASDKIPESVPSNSDKDTIQDGENIEPNVTKELNIHEEVAPKTNIISDTNEISGIIESKMIAGTINGQELETNLTTNDMPVIINSKPITESDKVQESETNITTNEMTGILDSKMITGNVDGKESVCDLAILKNRTVQEPNVFTQLGQNSNENSSQNNNNEFEEEDESNATHSIMMAFNIASDLQSVYLEDISTDSSDCLTSIDTTTKDSSNANTMETNKSDTKLKTIQAPNTNITNEIITGEDENKFNVDINESVSSSNNKIHGDITIKHHKEKQTHDNGQNSPKTDECNHTIEANLQVKLKHDIATSDIRGEECKVSYLDANTVIKTIENNCDKENKSEVGVCLEIELDKNMQTKGNLNKNKQENEINVPILVCDNGNNIQGNNIDLIMSETGKNDKNPGKDIHICMPVEMDDASAIAISVPEMPFIKSPLTSFEDIPYIDINDVKKYKNLQLRGQVPGCEIQNQLHNLELFKRPQYSFPIKSKQTTLLLGGHPFLPFIDDSDLPPDCPPPPPPPFDSPPESPHTTPPATPDTSPPETPHNSPPPSPSHEFITFLNLPTSALTVSHTITPVTISTNSQFDNAPQLTTSCAIDNQKAITSDSELRTNTLLNKSLQDSLTEDRYEIPEAPAKPSSSTSEISDQQLSKLGSNISETEHTKEKARLSDVVEDRYEIPDVVIAEANAASLFQEHKASGSRSWCVSTLNRPKIFSDLKRSTLERTFPPRPPRSRRSNGNEPPPRPPKNASTETNNDTGPPPIPPKSCILLSLKSPFRTSSPFHFPSRSAASTPSTVGSMPSTSSTPSGSKRRASSLRRSKRKSAKTRSWPFLLCDCLYANFRAYDDI